MRDRIREKCGRKCWNSVAEPLSHGAYIDGKGKFCNRASLHYLGELLNANYCPYLEVIFVSLSSYYHYVHVM